MINKYPYTDFSELNLDWFLTQFKTLYEEWLKMKENNAAMVIKYDNMVLKFGTLTETVNTFTAFVTNYFDNLDVQQEINNKLDDMVQQGTLQPLLAPYVAEGLPDVVTDWLNENVNPVGSAVMVDASLTISGAAADAKATGDNLSDLANDIGNLSNLDTNDKSNLVSAINEVNGYFLGGIEESVSAWLDEHPEATTTVEDSSLTEDKFTDTLKLKTIKDYVTPEMFGAFGDGVTDDTNAVQTALNSGKAVIADKIYAITTVIAKNVDLQINGTIKGQVIVADNACVHGGIIQQTTDEPCVIITCIDDTNGVQNGILYNCHLKPVNTGIGIKLTPTNGRLHDYTVQDIRIDSCEKSIFIYVPGTGEQWITKGLFENIFCGSPKNVILIDNQKTNRANCAEIVFRGVYAQGWTPDPDDLTTTVPYTFLNIDHGCASLIFEDSFVYDTVRDYHYKITNTEASSASDPSTITINGRIYQNYAASKFTDATSLWSFYFNGYYMIGSELPKYVKALRAQTPPKDRYGSFYFETYPHNAGNRWPALEGSYFSGFIGRGGVVGAANLVYGLSAYDGRVSVLRSNTNLLNDAKVYELATPYSGGVYTIATLPTSIRNGATCWCSDIKMSVTYYKDANDPSDTGHWYKPDGSIAV